MTAHISPAAAAALALARSPEAGPGELIHVAPGASVHDLDSGRWFTIRRGAVVRAWADPPSRAAWVFRLQEHWCCTQGVFTTLA